eukprot:6204869-Ditylum_brightwellii.AAC.1
MAVTGCPVSLSLGGMVGDDEQLLQLLLFDDFILTVGRVEGIAETRCSVVDAVGGSSLSLGEMVGNDEQLLQLLLFDDFTLTVGRVEGMAET